MLWQGTCDEVWWVYFYQEITERDWDDYCNSLVDIVENHSDHLTCLIMAFKTTKPEIAQIKRLQECIEKLGKKTYKANAIAFVGNLFNIKAVLNILNLKIKMPYPSRIFDSPEKALNWLASIRPINASATLQSINDIIPEDFQWKDLKNK